MKYIKQLDSLRGILVILVIIWHWVPQASYINYPPNGLFAVDVFFVLSGFLITGILLSKRDMLIIPALKTFYVRRFLRIFPAYYFYVILSVFLNYLFQIGVTKETLSLLTYTSNFYTYHHGWGTFIGHLWSLAVEEQFYLIWPVVILLPPERTLPYIVLLFGFSGIVCQYFMASNTMSIVLPFNCLHAFAIGSFFSWLKTYRKYSIPKFHFWLSITAVFCLLDLAHQSLTKNYEYNRIRLIDSAIGVWLISYILNNEGNKVFTNRYLISIGKISYGLYLYHFSLPYLIGQINQRIVPKSSIMYYQKYNHILFWVECVLLLLTVTVLSYRFIEQPILRLKEKY